MIVTNMFKAPDVRDAVVIRFHSFHFIRIKGIRRDFQLWSCCSPQKVGRGLSI